MMHVPLRYFELFDVVSELASEERLKVLQAANDCTSDEETGVATIYPSISSSCITVIIYYVR